MGYKIRYRAIAFGDYDDTTLSGFFALAVDAAPSDTDVDIGASLS